MHDPLVVAFEIVRPWPKRARHHDTDPSRSGMERRWALRYHHSCFATEDYTGPGCTGCQGRTNRQMFPPWRAGSYSRFSTLAGRGFYWPALITIWHREPGGADSGEVCKHYRDGKPDSRWRWHVQHWRIQVPPFQALRRALLTRCAWCGGRSRKTDPVNLSQSWDGPRGRWWKGEPGLFHHDCSSVARAHKTCLCGDPLTRYRDHGQCAMCGNYRAWRPDRQPEFDAATAVLATLPVGGRMTPEVRAEVEPLWAAGRARQDRLRAETNPNGGPDAAPSTASERTP